MSSHPDISYSAESTKYRIITFWVSKKIAGSRGSWIKAKFTRASGLFFLDAECENW